MNRINIMSNITTDMERGTFDQKSFDYLKECALQLDQSMQVIALKMFELGLLSEEERTHWCNCCAILPYVTELDKLKVYYPDDSPETSE